MGVRVGGERVDPSGLAATSPKTGEEYYWVRGYAKGGIYKKLLSPCFRETSNEVAERVFVTR